MARLKVVTQPEYQLTLTKEELQFLHDLVYTRVGGHPILSRRRLADGIERAISKEANIPGLRLGNMHDMDGLVSCRTVEEGG